MSDLEVPESAYTAAAFAADVDLTIYSSAPIDAALNAAAPLIVAAYLRQLIDVIDVELGTAQTNLTDDHSIDIVYQLLANKADELDLPGVA